MKQRYVTILIVYLLVATSLYGQVKPVSNVVQQEIKTDIRKRDSIAVAQTKQNAKQTLKKESAEIKTTVATVAKKSLPDTTKLNKNKISDTTKKKLEQKATNLEYNSEDPGNAPWKKQQLSKDDLKDFDLPDAPVKDNLPSIDKNKQKQYVDKTKNVKPSTLHQTKLPVKEEIAKSKKLERGKHLLDSAVTVKDRIEATSVQQELLNAKRIYSEKYIRRVYDSLGLKKGDSIFQVGSALVKSKAPKEELLQRINMPIKDSLNRTGLQYDDKEQSLNTPGLEKLTNPAKEFSEKDLSTMQLEQEALSELEPLKGNLMDSKYMPYVDSMRDVTMKAKRYSLNEKQLTEEMKQTVFKKKPSFMDKSYFELLLSFATDTAFSVVKIAPSWAYHFTNTISAGLGPDIAVEYQQKKFNTMIGFRSFVKTEFFKQRAYLQVEDNVGKTKVSEDALRKTSHSILAGGGVVLPISKKIAINVAVLYRVNQRAIQPGGSPWVFRIGLSSLKDVAKN